MAKGKKTLFFCQNCGYESPKWLGQCPGCREWNSFVEETVSATAKGKTTASGSTTGKKNEPVILADISIQENDRMKTEIEELDRVLGGGIVPGSMVLVGGDPGIGKSTLLLQVCRQLTKNGHKVLYVSGEESLGQIKLRAKRIGEFNENLLLLCETNLESIRSVIERVKPEMAVIDSIQTMYNEEVSSAPGSVSQVRESTGVLMQIAKGMGISVFIVGPIFTTLPLENYFSDPLIKVYLKNIVFYINYNLPGVFVDNIYPNAINGSLWSLPVEVFMYIMLPAIFIIFRKVSKKPVVFILAIISECVNLGRQIFFPDLRIVIYGSNIVDALALIPYFFVGMLFCFDGIKRYLNFQLATALLIIGMMLDISTVKGELLLFFVLPYFIFSFAFVENPLFKKCFSKNDYSYGMYLYGFVIQQILVNKLAYLGLSLNVFMLISTTVTMIFAILSWHLIEKPCQKIGKRLLHNVYIARLQSQEILKL